MVRFVNFKIFIIKMKSILSEIIKIELIKSVLSEGRVEDMKAKYPEDHEIVDFFVEHDPSGNNKYLTWEMKIYTKEDITPSEIANTIRDFHQFNARLQQKDINQYRTLADVITVLTPIRQKAEQDKVKKAQEEGVKKLYEDEDWLLLTPLTHQASCRYGANTQWCVASRDTSAHFKNYTEDGTLVFLIHKKSNHKFAFWTDNDEHYTEIYNPIDDEISSDVAEFLQGLVDGQMQAYLDSDSNDDYDDENEYTLYQIKADGTRSHWTNSYGMDDLHSDLTDLLDNVLFGRGSGRNTAAKIEKILSLFNLKLVLNKGKRGEPVSFTILDSDGDDIFDGDNFSNFVTGNGSVDTTLRGFINDTMVENYDVDSLYEIIKANNLPIVIEG